MGASARLVLAVSLLSACAGPASPTLDPGVSQAVTFETADGVELSGRWFGPEHATAGVVLAHMLPADQRSWFDVAQRLAEDGYRVLTFDFRGYCPGGDGGCSEGTKQIDAAATDLQAAVDRLRDEGVERIGIAGASMGGTAALLVAADDPAIGAVVTLSAPQAISGLAAGPDVLGRIAAPKLYLAGLGDPSGASGAAEALAAQSPQPVRLEILTTDAHGTDLLTSPQGERTWSLLEDWFARWVPVGPSASSAA